ncbi:TolC family protein [Flavobacteriaceae bacterium Ap0902]|nr:TolC family protein [Flavobacteriaceae bacterium Ap0902]
MNNIPKSTFFILIFFIGFLGLNPLSAQETWNLQDCIAHVLAHHPQVQQTAVNKNSATWELRQAKANLLPSVNANVNHSYSLGSTINPNNNVREALNVQYDQFSLNAGIDLFNWQNYLNIGLQKRYQSSWVYQLEAIKNQLTLVVVQQFYVYQNAKAWREVLQTQLAGIDEQITRTEKEVAIGTRPKSDIYDIKANMGNIQEQYIEAAKNEAFAKFNLLQTLNIPRDTITFVIENDTQELLPPAPTEVAKIVKNQPEIKRIEKNIEIANQKIKLNQAQALPQLVGQYQWSTFYSKVLDTDNQIAFQDQIDLNKNQYIGLGLSIPIFNKLQVKTQTALAENEKTIQELTLEKTKQELWTSVQKIVEAYDKAIEKYDFIQANFQNQKLSFERSQEKFNEGLIDAYTFFIIRNNWLNANYNLIQSKNEVLMQQDLLMVFGVD